MTIGIEAGTSQIQSGIRAISAVFRGQGLLSFFIRTNCCNRGCVGEAEVLG